MKSEPLIYSHGKIDCQGYITYDETATTRRPAVMVVHAWKGQDDFARQKAEALAHLGYVGFAVDMYGDGKTAHTSEQASEMMMPLFLDRELLQSRLKAAYQAICLHPNVDSSRVAGIGFCFGGLGILELFRSGVALKGVAPFHALLSNEREQIKAKTVPIAPDIKGSCLIFHGHDDPFVSAADIHNIQTELTQANVDWQMHIYGQTVHAFTVPQAHDPQLGLMYNPEADRRSWNTLGQFLNEIFK